MRATQIATVKWTQQHKNFRGDWVQHYWKTQGLDSRGRVLEALHGLCEAPEHGFPWKTLVELGCNAGPMLQVIKGAFPRAELGGIECNEVAVQAARERGLNVVCADLMAWLPQCPPKEWDVLLTHYTLAYISPEDLPSVLHSMRRIAKAALVIAEPTGIEQQIGEYPEWAHPYPQMLRRIGMKVKEIDVPLDEKSGRLNRITIAENM